MPTSSYPEVHHWKQAKRSSNVFGHFHAPTPQDHFQRLFLVQLLPDISPKYGDPILTLTYFSACWIFWSFFITVVFNGLQMLLDDLFAHGS